jgi:hypothetical protein
MKGRALSVENSTQLYWTLLAATHPLLERYDGAISGAPPRSPLGQSLSREKSGADAARPISTGGRGFEQTTSASYSDYLERNGFPTYAVTRDGIALENRSFRVLGVVFPSVLSAQLELAFPVLCKEHGILYP